MLAASAVAMEQWIMQHCAFIVETFFKMVALLLKCNEYFTSISVLLVTEKFLAAMPHSYE
jgi:hypothetical protein